MFIIAHEAPTDAGRTVDEILAKPKTKKAAKRKPAAKKKAVKKAEPKTKAKKAAKRKPKAKTKPAAKKKAVKSKAKAKPAAVGPTRSERIDMRVSKAEKAKVLAKAKRLRRTVTSVVLEAIEKIK